MAARTVTRADLSEAVYREVGLSRKESADLVESVLEEISNALVAGETIKVTSFGTFAVRQKDERVGRNPKTGDEFPIPEPIIPEKGARIMSLQEPTAKMSKSDPDDSSRILILDDPDTIRKRLKRAVTDSETDVRYDWDKKPGVSNLIEIMSLFTGDSIESIEAEYGTSGYGKFKEAVAEAIIAGLAPIRSAYDAMDDADVARLMQRGALDARTRAEGFQQAVRKRVGLAG